LVRPSISVIIPTIRGREEWLERCVHAYGTNTAARFEFIIVRDKPTCGLAWQEGAARARGDHLHFTADDLEPHEGWDEAAIRCIQSGAIPSARILNPDGTLQSCGVWGEEMGERTPTDIARVPFLSHHQWNRGGWVFPGHYYTDNAIAWRAEQLGIPTLVTRSYLFTHSWAMEGRYGQDRMIEDSLAYEDWKSAALAA
jgi:hypothetical protein